RNWNGLVGRVTRSVPERLGMDELAKSHFHLVGNGEMVNLVETALHRAGVLPDGVSTETYFNHYARVDEDEVERLAARFKASAGIQNAPVKGRGLIEYEDV